MDNTAQFKDYLKSIFMNKNNAKELKVKNEIYT